jgi:hypothetical protein
MAYQRVSGLQPTKAMRIINEKRARLREYALEAGPAGITPGNPLPINLTTNAQPVYLASDCPRDGQ